MRNKVKILYSYSHSGKMVPEFNIEEIRELVEGNYRIIYRIVSKKRIDILTVHHSSRDLSKRKIY
ncbi:type II toxin-antitoxin system RelE/ParE family toxin [Aequorivita sp. SDUM287046]|uniref:Type II toxin-antitoxin system RelE/ParE family toxin n=1 Tax=Aequorivita aurantiaca TaxID=3053356 RepID=A0ABT8DQ25_9FLAO|nr:type II toxin-antitoxin system RelE/ParE family toxin [Aequorivita aurantiaca]MDN3725167.1 type II toxin-antitoxin system RelE/ParE family toxin [Aequorivita aurantiaca]